MMVGNHHMGVLATHGFPVHVPTSNPSVYSNDPYQDMSTLTNSLLTQSQGLNGTNSILGRNGTSAGCLPYQKSVYPIALPIMLGFCFLSVILNLLIVLSARWARKPMSPTLYLSISLALADTFASLNLATGLIINSLLTCVFSIYQKNVCINLVVEVLRLGGILITVMHLLALGVNHWFGIARPLHYAGIMTRRAACLVIAACWIAPVLSIFIYFSVNKGQGFLSENCRLNVFMEELTWRSIFAASFFIPFLIMSGIYLHIYAIVKNHTKYRQRYQSNQQMQRNIKAVVTTVFILGSYIVGWMPGIIWYIMICKTCAFQLTHFKMETIVPLSIVFNILIILKALVNPIIYAARMSEIKVALNKMKYDILTFFCGRCVHLQVPVDTSTRGSLCETRSLRVSSSNASSRMGNHHASSRSGRGGGLRRTQGKPGPVRVDDLHNVTGAPGSLAPAGRFRRSDPNTWSM